jgi:hypothetical protein
MDNQNTSTPPTLPNPSSLPLQTPAPPTPSLDPKANQPLDRTDRFKRVFYQVLIGCLLASAAVAVTAVLAGGFNQTLGRALATIAMVALHALLSFGYVTENDKQDKKDGGRSIDLFTNTVFTLIVASFITSEFVIWQVLSGELTLKLYMLYGVALFATLHADVLYRIRRFESRIDYLITANYFTMAIVVAMLTVVIFANSPSDLGSFYYRLLAAIAIVDATMTITAIIMHKMYLQNHPSLAAKVGKTEVETAKTKNFWKNPLVILLLIFLAVQVVGTLVALFANGT